MTAWDPDRHLVIVDGASALWTSEDAPERRQDVAILLTWHTGAPGVQASGRVTRIEQTFIGSPVDGSPIRRRGVDSAEPYPEPLIDDDGFRLGPVLVTMDDLTLVEPAVAEVAAWRAEHARTRRTVHVLAPAACFGDLVPEHGRRITVDLDDPLIEVLPATPAPIPTGTHTGVMTEISRACDSGHGYTMLSRIAPGTAAEDVAEKLFVVLVLDEDA